MGWFAPMPHGILDLALDRSAAPPLDCRVSVSLADAGRWDWPVAVRFGAWSDFQHWISSTDLPAAARRVAGQSGTRVRLAGGSAAIPPARQERTIA